MAGLTLLVILIVSLGLAIWGITKAFRSFSRPIALGITAVVVAAPFSDALVGRAMLRVKCADAGKLVVNKSIHGVDGIYHYYGPFNDSPKYYGFKFVEGGGYELKGYEDIANYSGPVDRVTLLPDGSTLKETRVPSKALYELIDEPRQDSLFFYAVRTVVRTRATKEELASFVDFSFRGGWAERFFMMFTDAGPSTVASCGDHVTKTKSALHRSLGDG